RAGLTPRAHHHDRRRPAGGQHPRRGSDPGPRRRPPGRQGHARRAPPDLPHLRGDRDLADRGRGGGGMSARRPPPAAAAPPPQAASAGPMMRGPFAGMSAPPRRAKSFGPSAKRLLGRLAPDRASILLVVFLAVGSVFLSVSGPRVLGHATDVIFRGFYGSRL